MRVAINFYRSLDRQSVLFSQLRSLAGEYRNVYWIGGDMGFGIDNLSWYDAVTLATKMLAIVRRTESESVWDELKVTVQPDVKETPLPWD